MLRNSYKSGSSEIVISACELNDVNIVRLERHVIHDHQKDVFFTGEGPFSGIIIKKRSASPMKAISKPHVRAHFFAFLHNHVNDSTAPTRERRELRFWFYKDTEHNEKVSHATEYFKLLIEPETFPGGYDGFIKKVVMLMKNYRSMRRIEVFCQNCPEPEPEKEEWELYEQQPIENFITVLTPAVYDYQYLPEVPVSKKSSVTFRVRAAADAHIALSNVYGDTERRTYEIVLGANNNTKSVVKFGGQGPVVAEANTPGLLDTDEFKSFWIQWENNLLEVGSGNVINESRFLQFKIPPQKLHTINLMSVSTGPGSDGQWEFIEYLERVTPYSESRPAKRRKIRRALLWHAKKTKMLESLEDAFPNSLDTKELLRLSTVNLAEMLEAVVFLKDLQKSGLVLEVSRGIWLRGPVSKCDNAHEMQVVKEFSFQNTRDSPTIAIITNLFTEKIAVDSVLEKKVSYVRYSSDEGTRVYTLGKIGDQRIVSLKISKLRPTEVAAEKYQNVIAHLIESFPELQHVIIVGVGGAVPNYSDFDRHVRRGDIVVSVPRNEGGAMYVLCQDIDQTDPSQISYSTSVWSAPDDFIQNVVTQLSEYEKRGYDRPAWEKYIVKSQELLCPTDSSFHRPPAKTDKLYALLEGEENPVLIRHPQPAPDKQHLYKDNMPNVRLGPIASGKAVASCATIRMDFASNNCCIVAYDRGLHNLIEAIANSKLHSYISVLGICDYVDGSKGRTWQPYAALSAAAYVKNLIMSLHTFGRRRSYFH